uniref:Interleukin 10 receptor, beta n=1 Tax=Mastacembelus armatus TaxID=205130 RepID=A0A3Q3L8T1_9TELE
MCFHPSHRSCRQMDLSCVVFFGGDWCGGCCSSRLHWFHQSEEETTASSTMVCVSLPAPSSVSISSFNMEHILGFLPDPRTPSNTHFTVQIIHPRKNSWRPVGGCLKLKAGQRCNLTRVFKDPYDQYQARVQAFTPTQTSNWTLSEWFQPLSDTVLGPPDVSVSGCGNCLILQLRAPTTRGIQQNIQLKYLYREVIFHVQRTRDGAQFKLKLPYNEENAITYLQTGVEYCVTVSVTGLFNSNPVSSKPYCAFTSPPPPRSSLYLVFGLLGAFGVLGLLLVASFVYCSHLTPKLLRRHLPRILSYILLQGQNHGNALPELSHQVSASQFCQLPQDCAWLTTTTEERLRRGGGRLGTNTEIKNGRV